MQVRSIASATVPADLKALLSALVITASLGAVLACAPVWAQTNKVKNKAAASSAVYAERFKAVCAGCHGQNGRSDIPGVPVLSGQHSFYITTQLFLFRERRRNDPGMVALARQMSDDDLRGFSDYINTLPHVPAPTPSHSPDPDRMRLGEKLANEYRCSFCHGSDMAGGQQVPRIGGQKEDYLLRNLQGFKSGTRPAYTRAMTEALSHVPAEEFDVLSYFISNIDSK